MIMTQNEYKYMLLWNVCGMDIRYTGYMCGYYIYCWYFR